MKIGVEKEIDKSNIDNQQTDKISHNSSSNPFVAPSDGYLKLVIQSSNVGEALECRTLDNIALASCKAWTTSNTNIQTIPIYRGMKVYFSYFSNVSTCHAYFIAIN